MTPQELAAIREQAAHVLGSVLEIMQHELRANVGLAAQCGKRSQMEQAKARLHIIQHCEPSSP